MLDLIYVQSKGLHVFKDSEARKNAITVVPKVWSPDWQHQHHLGTYWRYIFLGSTLDLLNVIRKSGSGAQPSVF